MAGVWSWWDPRRDLSMELQSWERAAYVTCYACDADLRVLLHQTYEGLQLHVHYDDEEEEYTVHAVATLKEAPPLLAPESLAQLVERGGVEGAVRALAGELSRTLEVRFPDLAQLRDDDIHVDVPARDLGGDLRHVLHLRAGGAAVNIKTCENFMMFIEFTSDPKHVTARVSCDDLAGRFWFLDEKELERVLGERGKRGAVEEVAKTVSAALQPAKFLEPR